MDNKEKLIETLSRIDYKSLVEPRPMFSKEQYELFKANGLSKQEIEMLEQAEAYSELINLLPNDEKGTDRMLSALDAISTANPEINKQHILIIAEKDPEMLAKLLALAELMEQ